MSLGPGSLSLINWRLAEGPFTDQKLPRSGPKSHRPSPGTEPARVRGSERGGHRKPRLRQSQAKISFSRGPSISLLQKRQLTVRQSGDSWAYARQVLARSRAVCSPWPSWPEASSRRCGREFQLGTQNGGRRLGGDSCPPALLRLSMQSSHAIGDANGLSLCQTHRTPTRECS